MEESQQIYFSSFIKEFIITHWKMMMISLLTLTLIAVLLSLYAKKSPDFVILQEPVVMVRFHSAVAPISILYPQNWVARNAYTDVHNDKYRIAIISTLTHNYPFIRIYHRTMEQATLNDVAIWREQTLNQLFKLKKDDLKNVTINNRPALLRTFEHGGLLKARYVNCTQVYLLEDDDAYVVELCIDKDNDSKKMQQVFQEMINSIKLDHAD